MSLPDGGWPEGEVEAVTLTAAVLLDRRRAELAEAEERTGLSAKAMRQHRKLPLGDPIVVRDLSLPSRPERGSTKVLSGRGG
jgi:hypothetical protein